MAVRTWLVGAYDDETEGSDYLVKIDRDGTFHGWLSCDLSGVLDIMADQAYAEFIDEEPDTYTVYRLTDMGPVPVSILAIPSGEFMEVTLVWRQPGVRGMAGRRKESGFHKIVGA